MQIIKSLLLIILLSPFASMGQGNRIKEDGCIRFNTQLGCENITLKELQSAEFLVVEPFADSLALVKCDVTVQTGPLSRDMVVLTRDTSGQLTEQSKLFLRRLTNVQKVLFENVIVKTRIHEMIHLSPLQLKVI